MLLQTNDMIPAAPAKSVLANGGDTLGHKMQLFAFSLSSNRINNNSVYAFLTSTGFSQVMFPFVSRKAV